uniref:FAD/NAD(P)-binding domain-containing protein n=1 Tax=Araucaria cunninghamii TaxID=56994 RepID=A0A0D6R1J1_ARACU
MAWLPSVRRQWQSTVFVIVKQAANGFIQPLNVSSSLLDSTRIGTCSPSLIFHPCKSYNETGVGLQAFLNRRTLTTGSESRRAQGDQSNLSSQNATVGETKDGAESKSVKEDGEVKCLAGLGPTKPGEKARIVVLGTGWAGCRVMKSLDTKLYDVVCISPRNHMVFTPLLASTCVGTLEFRSVAEPVSRIQPALSRSPNSYFLLAQCLDIDTDNHEIYCETVGENGSKANHKWKFKVAYDKLIIASGAEALTFGIHGVKDHAIFLREVHHAQEIRQKLLTNLMLSDIPGITEEGKKRLLHCVVVGGGPTGVEFSGELSDFIKRDVHERYYHVKDYIHVTLIEANEILSSFDVGLRQYAIRHLTKSGVQLVRGVVKDVQSQKIILNDGTEVPYGLLVWSTGVGPSPFISSLKLPKSPGGRIGVDDWLRVPSAEDIYAIGDCSGFLESTNRTVLPALAQVGLTESDIHSFTTLT